MEKGQVRERSNGGKMAYWEYFEKIHDLLKGPPPTLKVPGLPATPPEEKFS